MIELPNWVMIALDVFYYAFIVHCLVLFAPFCVFMLVSPAVVVFVRSAPMRERVNAGPFFLMMVAIFAVYVAL